MTKLNQYKKTIFIILPLMYLSGLIGLQIPTTKSLFLLLTPFNLIASLGLLLWFHTDFNRAFIRYAILAFIIGFVVEVWGVETGQVFGNYWYGSVLGFKIWGVPLTVGCNWLMLNYCTNVVADKITKNIVLKILTASFLMTLLDIFIEPVAMRHGFWYWQNGIVPIQNYVAWFVLSTLISAIYFLSDFKRENKLALLLLSLQFLFFITLTKF